MFGAGTKASFANYFQKGKIQFSQCTVKLILGLTNYLFWFLLQNYPNSWQLLMDVIIGYSLTGQFDTI